MRRTTPGGRAKVTQSIGGGVLACAALGLAIAGSISYQYDALGRLQRVDYGDGTSVVYSYDAAGNRTSVVTVVADTTPPSVPTGLAASAPSYDRANLTWNPSTDTGGAGLAGYRIYRDGAQIGTSATTNYTDTTVAPSTTYSYTVAAYDNASPPNVSAPSSPVSVTTPGLIPAPPASISGPSMSYNGNYGISWSASAGATRYELWESTNGSPYSKVYDGPNTSKSFSGKGSGEYYYKAKACNANGCSAFSSTKFVLVCSSGCN